MLLEQSPPFVAALAEECAQEGISNFEQGIMNFEGKEKNTIIQHLLGSFS